MNEPDFEYLRVEVTRTESTELYLKVPKGWRPTGRDYALMAKAAEETVDRSEWDSFHWQDTVEVQGHSVCAAEEAEVYQVFDVVAALAAKAGRPETTAPSPAPQSPAPADSGAQSPAP